MGRLGDLENSELHSQPEGFKSLSAVQSKRFKVGDVVDYVYDEYWCHEGTAIAHENEAGGLSWYDTYWDSQPTFVKNMSQRKPKLLFNLNDFEEAREWAWLKYSSDDRKIITNQHGLSKTYYVRIGANESLETQIEQARATVGEKKSGLDSAVSALQWAWQDLMRLQAKQELSQQDTRSTRKPAKTSKRLLHPGKTNDGGRDGASEQQQ